ncbi:hypothetical protein BP6252_14145 [Coleophoma cylindrospora]|uniref:Uncharacterized protein n=1 Tax=Coleophoma cylindrospora TaxID=1849047 RepID=A0A3D8Q3M8_9HELO|nr:hypothetical protein BP6252_14145 [Coleophoma cylindrospora]
MPTTSPQSQLLFNLTGLYGTVPILIGVYGLLTPGAALASLDFPAPTTPEAQKLADGLTRMFAARDVVIGMICSTMWYKGERKLLGWVMILSSSFMLLDAVVSWDLIKGGLRNHLPPLGVALGLGAGLLGWFG